jgi:hypothetical protein
MAQQGVNYTLYHYNLFTFVCYSSKIFRNMCVISVLLYTHCAHPTIDFLVSIRCHRGVKWYIIPHHLLGFILLCRIQMLSIQMPQR